MEELLQGTLLRNKAEVYHTKVTWNYSNQYDTYFISFTAATARHGELFLYPDANCSLSLRALVTLWRLKTGQVILAT